MCGIAGIVRHAGQLNEPELSEVAFLLAETRHRGPDGTKMQRLSDTVALGSHRLRITDALNPDADMPMVSASERYTVVFNGEIYNHTSLRAELSNYPFRTQSDTETILAAFDAWGIEALTKCQGMFAMAVHDRVRQETFLIVDPSGQKFIYYYRDRDVTLICSEIEPLIANDARRKSWDKDGLQEYIAQRMILGEDTHIREIKKVEAGCFVVLGPQGNLRKERYYHVPIGDQSRRDVPAIAADIEKAVADACRDTSMLEVPHGYFLSGGIDSSAVLQHGRNNGLGLRAYTIGFDYFKGENWGIPSTFNEFDYARHMADHVGATLNVVTMTPETYLALIDDWAAMCGEPLDSSEAPMLIRLCQEAGKDGCKVIFSGSGPDEVFDGYGLGKSLTGIAADDVAAAYYDKFSWNFSVDMDRLMPGHGTRRRVIEKMDDMLAPYRDRVDNALQLAQLINLHGRCVAYEYRQMDVISMRHGIEARNPLADTRLTKAAFDFDPVLKQRHGVDKWIYKEALAPLLPEKIVRREKVGFKTPVELWSSSVYMDAIASAFEKNSALSSLGIIDDEYVRSIFSTGRPEYRCIDYRLYLLNSLVSRQSAFMS